MSRQSCPRVIVILLFLLAVGATYLQAECTEKETFSFESSEDSNRTIATEGYTAVYRIHNDGPSDLNVILKKPSTQGRKGAIKRGEVIDIAKSNDERLILEPAGKTAGSFRLIWAR